MKRFFTSAFIILIISIAFALIAGNMKNKTGLGAITGFYLDGKGYFHYIGMDDDKYSYYKLDETGKIITEAKLIDRHNGYFYKYDEIVADDDGNVYILVYEKDSQEEIRTKYVQVFNDRGREIKKIFESDGGEHYQDEESGAKSETMHRLQFINGKVSIFDILGRNTLIRYEYDHKTEGDSRTEYILSSADAIWEAIYTKEGSIYYLTAKGELFFADASGKSQRLDTYVSGREKVIPYKISEDGRGNLYFTDVYNFTFMKYNVSEKSAETVYQMTDDMGAGNRFEDVRGVVCLNDRFVARSLISQSDGTFITCLNENIKIEYKYRGIKSIFLNILKNFLAAFIILLLAAVMVLLILSMRSLFIKQIIVLVIIMLIPVIYIGKGFEEALEKQLQSEMEMRMYTMASSVAGNISSYEFESQSFPQDIDSEYRAFLDADIISQIMSFEYRFDIQEHIYHTLYFIKDGNVYFAYGYDEVSGMRSDYNFGKDNGFSLEVEEYIPNTAEITDTYGTWLICRAFIMGEQEPVGLVEIGTNKDVITAEVRTRAAEYIKRISVIILLGVSLFGVVLRRLLNGLKKLKEGLKMMTDGNFHVRVDIRSDDEIEDIADDFNKMSLRIEKYVDSVIQLNQTYEKFIHKGLPTIFGKDNIFELSLGDYVNLNINLLSISIKDFYSVSKNMTTEEIFEMSNSVFRISSQIIRLKGGFIENFSGFRLRAGFINETEYAVSSALKIIEKMDAYNKEYGKNIRLNMSVQNGDAIIGIVGNESRMQASIISQMVGNIFTLEKITENYHIRLIVTEEAFEKVEIKDRYNYCRIGRVYDETKKRFIRLYDFADSYGPAKRNKRMATKEDFEKGLDFYIDGNFSEARKKFIDVLRIDGSHEIAKLYLFQCDRRNPDIDWRGTISQ